MGVQVYDGDGKDPDAPVPPLAPWELPPSMPGAVPEPPAPPLPPPPPPAPPLPRVITEGDTAPKCHLCGSTIKWKRNWWTLWISRESKGCIQGQCRNFWDNRTYLP